jgi:antitoxin component YwqK of YwqJK toxin-antitoxin module
LSIEQYYKFRKHGVWIEWYENGKIKQIEKYIDGKLTGSKFVFYSNGLFKSKERYNCDRIIDGDYMDINGNISSRIISGSGTAEIRDDEGTITATYHYDNYLVDGESLSYINGMLDTKKIYSKGEFVKAISYDRNGNVIKIK